MSTRTPTSGTIKFSDIRKVFNSTAGSNSPVPISQYYANSGSGYTTNIILIPRNNTEPIKLTYFYNLAKTSTYPIITQNGTQVLFIASPNYTKAYFIFDNTDNTDNYANSITTNRAMTIDLLLVGGGGAGGITSSTNFIDAGGGGGGSVIYFSNYVIGQATAITTIPMIIGKGGTVGIGHTNNTNGGDTIFGPGLTATGGISSTNNNGGGPTTISINLDSYSYQAGSEASTNPDTQNYGGVRYAGGGAGAGGNGKAADGGNGYYVNITDTGFGVFGQGGGGALADSRWPNARSNGISGSENNVYGGGGTGRVTRIRQIPAKPGIKGCVVIALRRQ
jgi:hypothetical protein